MSAQQDGPVIRSVLIPLSGMRLLVPNSLVAEVFGYVQPDPIADSPDWLLGSVGWRGVVLPLVSFEAMTGGRMVPPGIKGRVIVLYGLGPQVDRAPYVGLLSTDVPRLFRATNESVHPAGERQTLPGVSQWGHIEDGLVAIPDLDYLVNQLAPCL